MAQLKQIAKTAQDAQAGAVIEARAGGDVPLALVPVGPLGRDQRATAIGQAGQRKENSIAANTADYWEHTTLKGVALADDRHRIRDIAAMGSLSPFRWDRCIISSCNSSTHHRGKLMDGEVVGRKSGAYSATYRSNSSMRVAQNRG